MPLYRKIFNPSQAVATRAIGNTGWQVSTSQNAFVTYSVSVSVLLTVLVGAAGYVALEIATDAAFTSPQEIGRTGLTGGAGIALSQSNIGQVFGFVPAGYYVRLRSVNTLGTPTYAYLSGQETTV